MSPEAAACVALGRRAPRSPHAAGTTDRKGGGAPHPAKARRAASRGWDAAGTRGAETARGTGGGRGPEAQAPSRLVQILASAAPRTPIRAARGPPRHPISGRPSLAHKSALRLPGTIQEPNRTHRTEPSGSLGSDVAGGLHVGVRPALHLKGPLPRSAEQAGGAAPSAGGVHLRTQRLA